MFLAIFWVVFLGAITYESRRKGQPVSLVMIMVGVLGVALVPLRLDPLAYVLLLLGPAVLLWTVAVGFLRAAHRAAIAGDEKAVQRTSRIGIALSGMTEWTVLADMVAWKEAARSDHAAARPILERVVHRSGRTQDYYALVLEAFYGDLDVAALVDQRWSGTQHKLHPYLRQIAISYLVTHGRTHEALARLDQVKPSDLTGHPRFLVVADLAAATGDQPTLERLIALGDPLLDAERAELYRGIAMLARGEAQAGADHLRSLDVPPDGTIAHDAAKRLGYGVPVFDERELPDPARNGLQGYRALAKAAAPVPTGRQ